MKPTHELQGDCPTDNKLSKAFLASVVGTCLFGIASVFSVIFAPYLLPVLLAIALAFEQGGANTQLRNGLIYLSTFIIPAIILAMAIPLLDWQIYRPFGIDREIATKVFSVLFWIQSAWIILFPFLIKGSKWYPIAYSVILAGAHIITSFLAAMAISGTWL